MTFNLLSGRGDITAIERNGDAFGRFRVSTSSPVFDNKNIYNSSQNQWEEAVNGAGAAIAHIPAESSVGLTVGTVSGGSAIRQTKRYHAYIPGKSQYITLTGVLGAGKTNVTTRVGYFDANDGLFFEQADTTLKVVIRSSTSGSPVETEIDQTEWNMDKFDGTGPSTINLDTSKAQIFIIDFQWLGVGRVRFGFSINGKIHYCHEFKNANVTTTVYMATPTLPIRYEIVNTDTTASTTTLKEICCSVSSEGGYTLPGFEFAAAMGITTKAVTTRAPILAIRLKGSFSSKENRRTARFLRANLYSDADTFFEVAHLHTPSSITATWSDVGTGSALEKAVGANVTSITGNPEHIIESSYVGSGVGSSTTTTAVDSSFINLHSFISQNMDSDNSQIFLIYATSFTGTANVAASISWLEFD